MHILGSVYYGKMIPVLYSSPVLIAASVWLLVQLRQTGGAGGSRARVGC
ncbi:MAG TPA: hypothetical protein PLP42_17650 [Acidobacteriota bacterium]|nr:hypothetical protein [Acidobacteriota bacterium]